MERKQETGGNEFLLFFQAENRAFKEKGVKVGRIEFTCPLCGGTAIANRYWCGRKIHNLGSYCKGCNFTYM